MIISITPIFYRKAPRWIFLTLGILIVLCTVMLLKSKNYETHTKKNLIRMIEMIIVWVLWTFGYRLLGVSTAPIAYTLLYDVFWFTGISTFIYSGINYEKERIKMYNMFMIIYLINSFSSIYYTILYPETVYVLNNLGNNYLNLNIGNTDFETVAVIVFVMTWTVFRIKRDYFSLIIAIVSFLLIILYQRSTGILGAILFLFLFEYIHLWKGKNISAIFVLSTLLGMLGIVLLFIYGSNILEWLGTIVMPLSERVGKKLIMLAVWLQGDYKGFVFGGDSSLLRFDLFKVSINNWLKSVRTFVFGNGVNTINFNLFDYSKTSMSGLTMSQHSIILDTGASYGIIGYLWIISIFRKLLKYVGLSHKDSLRRYKIIIILLVIYNELFNSVVTPMMGLLIFLIIPILFNDILPKEVNANDD